jgi:hypothetical protein
MQDILLAGVFGWHSMPACFCDRCLVAAAAWHMKYVSQSKCHGSKLGEGKLAEIICTCLQHLTLEFRCRATVQYDEVNTFEWPSTTNEWYGAALSDTCGTPKRIRAAVVARAKRSMCAVTCSHVFQRDKDTAASRSHPIIGPVLCSVLPLKPAQIPGMSTSTVCQKTTMCVFCQTIATTRHRCGKCGLGPCEQMLSKMHSKINFSMNHVKRHGSDAFTSNITRTRCPTCR